MRKSIDFFRWDNLDALNSSPVLKCKLDGHSVTFLLDTGASVSLLDENFLKRHKELHRKVKKGKYSYNLDSLSGRKKTTKVLDTENLCIVNSNYTQEFKVANLNLPLINKGTPYDGILGFDFFLQNKITLNFKDFTIADSK